MVKFRRANLVKHAKTDSRRAEKIRNKAGEQTAPEKIKLARTGLEPGVGTQPVLNSKFIKIVKRLYLKFFALYIDRAKRVCPARKYR